MSKDKEKKPMTVGTLVKWAGLGLGAVELLGGCGAVVGAFWALIWNLEYWDVYLGALFGSFGAFFLALIAAAATVILVSAFGRLVDDVHKPYASDDEKAFKSLLPF